MSQNKYKHVYLIGVGGMSMSAIAKLLMHAGVKISASDTKESEQTRYLKEKGVTVHIGREAAWVTEDVDLVIYSSAVPSSDPGRAEALKRGVKQLTNAEFLGEWTDQAQVYLVTGTHGKSTTTAMLGLMMMKSDFRPTVLVGSVLKEFPEGNLSIGSPASYVIEGDEYARHFLSFRPAGVVINNLELDHTDVYPTIEDMVSTFRELLSRVRDRGVVVANIDDERVADLVRSERSNLEARGITIKTFGFAAHADVPIVDYANQPGEQRFAVEVAPQQIQRFSLKLPGKMNVSNACGALTLALSAGVPADAIRSVLSDFRGIWRRFEVVSEKDQVLVVSDYAHHPGAVLQTLMAAKSFYPGRRLVVCFQPHHRNRVKHLFADFVTAFDLADVLILSEVFDVAGRDAGEDASTSSRDLRDAIIHHDADRAVRRTVEFVEAPDKALELVQKLKQPNDLVLVMGAGDIYLIANKI